MNSIFRLRLVNIVASSSSLFLKMSSSDDEMPQPKRQKGQVNKSDHKKEKRKIARREGREYVNSKGNVVPARSTGPDCECRDKCTTKFNQEEKTDIIMKLYSRGSKNEQDTFLMGLIERFDIKQKSATDDSLKKQTSSFHYFAMRDSERVKVCRKAFLNLHSVSNKVVFRLSTLVAQNKTPNDNRGKHGNRGNVKNAQIIAKIDSHISEFPVKVSKYKAVQVSYLDSDLNVNKMHELFLEKYPDLANDVKYEYYLKHFRQNYGYRFGRPQVDVCSTCEDLNTKIKSPFLNENAKRVAVAELLVHKRRAKKFYNKLQEITNLCNDNENTSALVFDYMQNLPLPFLPVQDMFYLRKLWLYVFCVHNLSDNSSVFYTYHEGEGNKGPDEVCSFLSHYITNFLSESVSKLHVFSDACGGQNRNHTLVRLLSALTVTEKFQSISQYFPVRGHSFLACDRNFACVKRVIRKRDRVYLPSEYNDMMASARKKDSPFVVYQVTSDEILNFKDWWPQYFKKTSNSIQDKKNKFSISKYKQMKYNSQNKGYVSACEFIDGLQEDVFKLLKVNHPDLTMATNKAYDGSVGINKKKLGDLQKIVKYIPEDKREFYTNILSWKTKEGTEDDE